MAKLTKADILKGATQVHSHYFEKLGGEIDVRPLTEGEWAEIEAMRVKGTKIKGQPKFDKNGNFDVKALQQSMAVEIDAEEIQLLEYEARAKAVAYGLSVGEDKWTVEEVKQLRPIGVIEEIAQFIYEISGLSQEANEFAHSFRQE